MDWTNFSKQQPKDIGYYITYCIGIGVVCPYVLFWWNGTNFIAYSTQTVYPISVSSGGNIIQSCSVSFYSELTVPPQT